MNRSSTFHYLKSGRVNRAFQGAKEQINGRRFENHTSMTGHVTSGPKSKRTHGALRKPA